MYGCESWTIKLSTKELMLLNRDVGEDLWEESARRSNQSIMKEISPEYSLEGLMLKLKLRYFGHLNGKSQIIRKAPDAGKDWRQEEKEMTEDEMVGWHHQLDWPASEQAPGIGDGQGGLACCYSCGRKESYIRLSDWTELNWALRLPGNVDWIPDWGTKIPHASQPKNKNPKQKQYCSARALALSCLRHTANSHWLSVLHMVMYMFQWYSPNSLYPLLPPRPSVSTSQICSLHLADSCWYMAETNTIL